MENGKQERIAIMVELMVMDVLMHAMLNLNFNVQGLSIRDFLHRVLLCTLVVTVFISPLTTLKKPVLIKMV